MGCKLEPCLPNEESFPTKLNLLSRIDLHFEGKNILFRLADGQIHLIKRLEHTACLVINGSSGNTKGGSITVQLTSCLTGLQSAV
jgi:hypothetical protein